MLEKTWVFEVSTLYIGGNQYRLHDIDYHIYTAILTLFLAVIHDHRSVTRLPFMPFCDREEQQMDRETDG